MLKIGATWPWDNLDRFSSSVAIFSDEDSFSYQDLLGRADAWSTRVRADLPDNIVRPLILLETANEMAPVAAYLGALRAGWPVILLADGAVSADNRICETYQPNILYRRQGDDWTSEKFSADPVDLHPDLAVLLSTSGTTGAPKLVRLSRENIASNAAAIADYLELTEADRAVSTLAFNYSYGMSVLNSHLFHGASVILTNTSVVDPEFWDLARSHNASSLALVPVQFDLLEKIGFDGTELNGLRYITQAGGKLNETSILRFENLGVVNSWKFYVMYGQTEAGPRMSYVPPADLADNCQTIGQPIPGGAFSLITAEGEEITQADQPGELVFRGPGVMMGYAESRSDLSLEDVTPVLHTGDIAERLPNSFYRIVGRASRFIKVFGLRISLDEVENSLRRRGIAAYCTGSDENMVVFTSGEVDADGLVEDLAKAYKLTHDVVRVEPLDEVPLLSSGKVDYKRLSQLAKALQPVKPEHDEALLGVFQHALRTETLDLDKSFIDHGGDSLSYLEVQLGLSSRLGDAPAGWERMALSDLLALEPRAGGHRFWHKVPADLLGRFLALFAVIALHATHFRVGGGAFLLIALSGYSLARFQSDRLFSGQIGKVIRLLALPIALCYYGFILAVNFLWEPVDPEWFLFLGNFDKEIFPAGLTPYWFVCLYVQIVLLVSLPFISPRVRKIVTDSPFEVGVTLTMALMAFSAWAGLDEVAGALRHHNPIMALQLFFLGWCAFYADSLMRKSLISTLILANCALFWADISPSVTIFILLGTLTVVWQLSLPLPRKLAEMITWISSAAMFIYLGHTLAIVFVHNMPIGSDLLIFILAAALSVAFGWGLKGAYFQGEAIVTKVLSSAGLRVWAQEK